MLYYSSCVYEKRVLRNFIGLSFDEIYDSDEYNIVELIYENIQFIALLSRHIVSFVVIIDK